MVSFYSWGENGFVQAFSCISSILSIIYSFHLHINIYVYFFPIALKQLNLYPSQSCTTRDAGRQADPGQNLRAHWLRGDLTALKTQLSRKAGQSSALPRTHPRPGCRAWWHQRWPVPAGWTPPPRSRRAWRGAGPEWCCRSRAVCECSPRTPSPCRTIWEGKRRGQESLGEQISAAHVTRIVFNVMCSWLRLNPALWFQ